MADVTIEGSLVSGLHFFAVRGGPFWTSPTVGYVVYTDSAYDLKYRKTADGGANWAAAVNIRTGTVQGYDCWADWQTAGDAGTKIHIAYMDTNSDDVRYVYLDTSDDSIGGDDQIEACQGNGIMYVHTSMSSVVSITKTRGGNFVVTFKYEDSASALFFEFYTSPDGNTWTNETAPWEADKWDLILLFPGNEADNQDAWATFWDRTADELSLKTYDDSGDSWSEQLISASMAEAVFYFQMDGQVRLSDGHLIFAAWNLFDNANADLMVWDINGAGSITAKTNVLTDAAEYIIVSVFINHINDDIYIAYVGGTAAQSLVKAFYQKSVDGGANWGGQQALQADAEDDERWISAGAMKAAWGGKFQPAWHNEDLHDLFTNSDNGISLTTFTAHIKNLSDSVAIADSISKAVGKPESDSVALADALSKEPGKIEADSIALADALTKEVGKIEADSVTIADSFARVVAFVRAFVDTLLVTDSIVKAVGLAKADTVAIADSVAKGIAQVHADTVSITDSITKSFGLAQADTMTIVDSLTKAVGITKADTVAIADAISKGMGITLSDSVVIADDLLKGYAISLTDTVVISDAFYMQWGLPGRLAVARLTAARLVASRLAASRLHKRRHTP